MTSSSPYLDVDHGSVGTGVPHGKRRWPVIAIGAVLVIFVGVAVVIGWGGSDSKSKINGADPKPSVPAGWQQVWRDDFNGPAGTLPSADRWVIDRGTGYPGGAEHWGTGEVESYTDDPRNVSHDGKGRLRITPLRDRSGAWTSARIESARDDFQPPAHGKLRVESRLRLPAVTGAGAAGYWSGFWMSGTGVRGNPNAWPGTGEFDIMEHVNGTNQVGGTLHCGIGTGGPCDEQFGLGATSECAGRPCAGNWHTYAFEWDRSTSPEQLRWYLDGKLYHTVKANQMDARTWADAVHNTDFILFNVAIGGGFPSSQAQNTTPNGATRPGSPMLIDYVTVLSAGGTPQATSGPQRGFTAHTRIRAENASSERGTAVQPSTDQKDRGEGHTVGWLAEGDQLVFDDVSFDAVGDNRFTARVASDGKANRGAGMEIRLDSPTSAPMGFLRPGGTGGRSAWKTFSAEIPDIKGTHDVYLTVTGPQADNEFMNVNWISFSRS